MTVSWISRPFVYKGHVISVKKLSDTRYVFSIKKTVDLDLSGVAPDLPSAFEKARAMIDKMEDDADE